MLDVLMYMKNKPLFSVLIANYNNGKYLMNAIDSIYKQLYTNWEIIIVDDGSNDNSNELYEEFERDSRIKIYYNEINRGCGFTKHRCVEMANGELCGFLDPDDELLPNAIIDSVEALLDNDKNAISFSRFYYCDENMNVISKCRLLDLKGQTYFEHHDYYPEHFVAFRVAAYKRTIGIDPNIKAAVDQDLYFKLEEVGDIIILDKFTYKYRKNPHALTSISFWCEYWNILVRHNVCIRRGLSIMDYAFCDFSNIINEKVAILSYENECRYRSSFAYRLGAYLLYPIKKIKQLFN